MKFYTVFTILICFIIFEANSQQYSYSKTPSEMSKYEFLTLASNSDSLTAVVNMFFRKRRVSTTSGLVLVGGATLIGLAVTMAHATRYVIGTFGSVVSGVPVEDTNDPGGTIILAGLTGGAAIFTIGRTIYSKNDLYRIITEFEDTGIIPYEYANKLAPKDFTFKSRWEI